MDQSDAISANKARWDEVVDIHLASDGMKDGYDLSGARAGTNRLTAIEEAEIGRIDGLDVLHLQCHFGLDTLRLRRLGARVTGLDFAPKAIAAARSLFAEAGESGTFVEGDVYDASKLISGLFDRVFVNWGAINWLPDIAGWAHVVADCLKSGGRLYLCETHPVAAMLDHEADRGDMGHGRVTLRFPYFHRSEPTVIENPDYADPDASMVHSVSHEWAHPVSDIVNALISAGLTLEWMHEHDRIAWKLLPIMEQADARLYRLPADFPVRVPLALSLSARKTA